MARKDDKTVGGVLLIYFRGLQLHKNAPYSKERGDAHGYMERAVCFFCCDYRRRYSCSNHYEEEVTALPSQSKRLLNFLFFEDYRHRSPFHPYCSLPRKKSQHRHGSRLALLPSAPVFLGGNLDEEETKAADELPLL